jgi:N-acyl-D-amino-acid deacylase
MLANVLALAFDVLIRGGRIVDGSGNTWFRGDVAIRGDTIVAVAPKIEGEAGRVIDATGKVVAPGFIDLHTHARGGIFEVPSADNFILQGVTTIFEGPDGASPVPVGPFLARVEKLGVSPNFAMFVGHGSVRDEVMGSVDRAATPAELEQMQALVRTAMHEGAFGLSTGLFYVPGNFASTEEVIALAKAAGELGGSHTSHMRDEMAKVTDSVRETIRIGEEGGLPTQITHHKIAGKRNWGRSVETLKLIDEARARGVDVTSDQYPYTASRTGLNALFPRSSLEGGRQAMLERLADPATRAKIREEVIDSIGNDRGGGDLKNVQIAAAPHDVSLAGKTLADVLCARGVDPTIEGGAELAMELMEKSDVMAVFHMMSEEDVIRILRHPATMIASDGEVPVFGKDAPHPRSYGTFARVLGVYVREKNVLTLEDAVRKMSSYPASRVGLTDRGLLRPGMKADVVVFDPDRIADKATYTNPHAYAEGVAHVLVNGVLVVDGGKVTQNRPGRVLRHVVR